MIADPAPNLHSVSKFGSVRYDLYNGSSNLGETCAFCHAQPGLQDRHLQ